MLLKNLVQLLALIGAACIVWLVCFGGEIDKAAVMGHTPAEVRKEYGEPSGIADLRKFKFRGFR